jgi:hypothetical protein
MNGHQMNQWVTPIFPDSPRRAGFVVASSTGRPTAQVRALSWCEALLPGYDDELPSQHAGKSGRPAHRGDEGVKLEYEFLRVRCTDLHQERFP